MGDNWDDDEFEPDLEALAIPKEEEPAPEPKGPVHAPKTNKKKEINLEDLGRELTPAERETLQRRAELKMFMDDFGGEVGGEETDYNEIVSKEEFEAWGTKVGTFLGKRHKAGHYGDMINKLFNCLTENISAAEIRKMSNLLKAIADAKKDEKPKTAVGGAKKKKVQLKASKTSTMYDDFETGSGGVKGAGAYDDYEDDFM